MGRRSDGVELALLDQGKIIVPGEYIRSEALEAFAITCDRDFYNELLAARWRQHKDAHTREINETTNNAHFRVSTRKGEHTFSFGACDVIWEAAGIETLLAHFRWSFKDTERGLPRDEQVKLILHERQDLVEVDPDSDGNRRFIQFATDRRKSHWAYQFTNNRVIVHRGSKVKANEQEEC